MIKTAIATPPLQISGVETAAKTLAAKTLAPKTSPSRTAVSGGQCFPFTNDDIADTLEQVADLLEIKEENYYRVRAYREAGQTIRGWEQPILEIWRTAGTRGLEKLPHVGQRLASSLEELLHTGQLGLRDRLLAEVSPEDLFTTIPGIGKVLAHRICEELKIETLEELELAAHTGKLETVAGFGKGRIHLIRDELETMLNRSSRQRVRQWQRSPVSGTEGTLPSVDLLLELDGQYRMLAAEGQLPTIAPRRFNPLNDRWLPVMHREQAGWWFSVLYSNTARAHELGKTHDWVVIFYEREDTHGQYTRGQCTVVTETRGALRGQRVVRGHD